MKAAWYERNGEARDVLVVGEMQTPVAGPGEVLVKVSVSGVNPSDVKSRRARPLIAPRIVPHSDGGGVIEAVGAGVASSRIGQRVWIWNGQFGRPMGTCAQYIAVPEEQAVSLPADTSFDAAACMGIPGLTAFEAVRRCGEIKGKNILVIAAAASVGHYAAQMAALKGARVIGTVSSETKAAHARMAGVAETINYKTENVAERVKALTGGRGVDAIIDMDFSTTADLLRKGALAPHGTVSCYGSNSVEDTPIPFRVCLPNSLSLQFFLIYDLTPQERSFALQELSALLKAGVLSHAIGARYPLSDIIKAHEAVEQGKVMGNIVIDIA
ncbi:MAG: NADPH:quinone reductase [Sheuella sp.]|nr:NADPH:quinone reductase [Sheuella sp.]